MASNCTISPEHRNKMLQHNHMTRAFHKRLTYAKTSAGMLLISSFVSPQTKWPMFPTSEAVIAEAEALLLAARYFLANFIN